MIGDLPVASMTLQDWLLQADKLFCMTLDEVLDLQLPQWLPVGDAEALVVDHLTRSAAASQMQCTTEDVCPVPNAQIHAAAQVPPLCSHWRQSHLARRLLPDRDLSSVQSVFWNLTARPFPDAAMQRGQLQALRASTQQRQGLWKQCGPDHLPCSVPVLWQHAEANRPDSLTAVQASTEQQLAASGAATTCLRHDRVPSGLDRLHACLQSAAANGSAPLTAAQATMQQQLARSTGEGTLDSQDEARRSVMREIELDLDCWQALDFPSAVLAALVACKNGVKRAHLVDARLDGGLLLELYTRDGFHGSTMLSSDFYEVGTPPERGTGLLMWLPPRVSMRPQHLPGGVLTVQHAWACSGHHTHLPCLLRFVLAACRSSTCRSPSTRRSSSLPVFCTVQHATTGLVAAMMCLFWPQGICPGPDIICGLLEPTCQVDEAANAWPPAACRASAPPSLKISTPSRDC